MTTATDKGVTFGDSKSPITPPIVASYIREAAIDHRATSPAIPPKLRDFARHLSLPLHPPTLSDLIGGEIMRWHSVFLLVFGSATVAAAQRHVPISNAILAAEFDRSGSPAMNAP